MQQLVQNLPTQPGIYQYFDTKGKLLYVGKAKNLKHRVKSYWRSTPTFQPNPTLSIRIQKMLQEAHTLEYIIVESEEDALILENSLIKQLKPKYNILLRDDKTYPYIYLDESHPFPRFEITRKVVKGKQISYYGPFPTGGRALLDALYEIYPLVQKKSCLREGKTCLFFQIKKCLGPCEGHITAETYHTMVQEVKESILKRHKLTQALEEKMGNLAQQERFEEAAKLRDMSQAIKTLNINSTIDMANQTNLDLFAILNGTERGVVVKLFIREGKIISSSYNYFRHTHNYDENEAYRQTLLEFYSVDAPHNTKQILTAHPFEDAHTVATTLSKRFETKIEIHTPQRGAKAKLIHLALQNCQELLKKENQKSTIEKEIATLFSLETTPYRVETFDNSHMMGSATVGGMVVWHEGSWEKSSYKRFKLHAKDEYAQMKEMLTRRIEHFKEEGVPDLWILDGGKANLALALALLQQAQVNLEVIAIAKEKLDAKAHRAKGAAKDKVYTKEEIFDLPTSDKRLHWVQRQRDEAHRYALAFHKQQKQKEDTQISLLNKKGIGKATVKKLIDYFGTFEAIHNASSEEIAMVTNTKIATLLKEPNFQSKL
jgi:excinuclease ABC subunit C